MEYLVKNFKNRGSKMIFWESCYLQTEIAEVDHAKMVEYVQTVVMDSNVCVLQDGQVTCVSRVSKQCLSLEKCVFGSSLLIDCGLKPSLSVGLTSRSSLFS